jgi:hypothetical protein
MLVMPKHLVVTPAEPPSGSFWLEMMHFGPAVRPADIQAEDIVMEDQWSSVMCGINVIMEDVQHIPRVYIFVS